MGVGIGSAGRGTLVSPISSSVAELRGDPFTASYVKINIKQSNDY